MESLGSAMVLAIAVYTGHQGQAYEWERIRVRVPETGVIYMQLTNAPVNSQVLYFEHRNNYLQRPVFLAFRFQL